MNDQIVLVAGGSRGIGRACVDAFLQAGARVAAVARSVDEEAAGAGFLPVRADLARAGEAERATARVRERLGRVTCVVHCVGDIGEPRPLAQLGWGRWRETFDLCLGSAVQLVAATIGDVAAGAGSYVFVSSLGAHRPYPGIADYCAAKAALSSLVRSLALELAPARARANAVSPAVVDTDLLRRAPFSEAEAASWHKLGRVGRPEEVARLCLYLASPAAAWVTGQDWIIDGGMGL
ncbi:MAG TPA: SDR family oxidoreductase [Kofleriaceae bacterium]|nr:SDR family oxidoreductase [Kofleriaceae bacterium]